jgi:hypothetical protein
MLVFSKHIGDEKNMEVFWGAIYHPELSSETPQPYIGLSWTPNKHWHVMCGFPELRIDYNFSKNTSLGANLFITGGEYTLSKSEKIYKTLGPHVDSGDIIIDKEQEKNKIGNFVKYRNINRLSYADYGIGLEFKQRMFSNLIFKVNSGYTFYRMLEFKKDNRLLLDTKFNDNLFIRVGISFMI